MNETIFYLADKFIKNRAIIYMISVMLVVLYLVMDFDISIPFFIIFWLIIGNLIISISFTTENIHISRMIFYATFFTYLGFMVLTHLLYIDNPFTTYFYVPDSAGYYNKIYQISQSGKYNGPGLLDLNNINVTTHGTGLYYLSWVIGRISYAIGGSNSLVIHKIVVVWCVSLSNVFLYNTSRYFLDKKKSKIIALTYGLFSYSLLFSTLFLRDLHVALFITIGFYIVLGSFKIKNLIILILLAVITFTFRPTHAIFYGLLIVFYIYLLLKKYKFFVIVFSVILLLAFIRLGISSQYSENLIERSQTYSKFHAEREAEAGGAAKLYGFLPSFLHPPTRIIQSQINPFSLFSVSIVSKGNVNAGQSQYLTYAGSIADFFWFVIWMIIIYGMSRKHIRKSIPNNLFYAFSLAMVLLILAGFSSFDMRRLLGVYPIIYLTAIVILFNFTKDNRKVIVNTAVVIFLSLGILLKFIF